MRKHRRLVNGKKLLFYNPLMNKKCDIGIIYLSLREIFAYNAQPNNLLLLCSHPP